MTDHHRAEGLNSARRTLAHVTPSRLALAGLASLIASALTPSLQWIMPEWAGNLFVVPVILLALLSGALMMLALRPSDAEGTAVEDATESIVAEGAAMEGAPSPARATSPTPRPEVHSTRTVQFVALALGILVASGCIWLMFFSAPTSIGDPLVVGLIFIADVFFCCYHFVRLARRARRVRRARREAPEHPAPPMRPV